MFEHFQQIGREACATTHFEAKHEQTLNSNYFIIKCWNADIVFCSLFSSIRIIIRCQSPVQIMHLCALYLCSFYTQPIQTNNWYRNVCLDTARLPNVIAEILSK